MRRADCGGTRETRGRMLMGKMVMGGSEGGGQGPPGGASLGKVSGVHGSWGKAFQVEKVRIGRAGRGGLLFVNLQSLYCGALLGGTN